ncbi:MAG TPA: hypothetical protein VEH84_16990 [Alphaproteobacteria bacterium]|nr:hypothetical protein [Alphaproteobacteria bacterium]
MAKKFDLGGALARTVAAAAKPEDRFAKAESFLESRSLPPIAPNAPRLEEPPPAPKPPREKVIRDQFSFPEEDHALLAILQKKLLGVGTVATKSELVRLGLAVLDSMAPQEVAEAHAKLRKLKPGRPGRHD